MRALRSRSGHTAAIIAHSFIVILWAVLVANSFLRTLQSSGAPIRPFEVAFRVVVLVLIAVFATQRPAVFRVVFVILTNLLSLAGLIWGLGPQMETTPGEQIAAVVILVGTYAYVTAVLLRDGTILRRGSKTQLPT